MGLPLLIIIPQNEVTIRDLELFTVVRIVNIHFKLVL